MSDTPEEPFYAAIGKLAMASAGIDAHLAILVARAMSMEQDQLDITFPSVFVFSARAIDQKLELVKKAVGIRLEMGLSRPRHENGFRAADLIERMLNTIIANITSNKWLRNVAIHGSFADPGGGIILMPHLFDQEGWKAVGRKGEKYKNGLTLEILAEATESTQQDLKNLDRLGLCLQLFLAPKGPDPSEFLEAANGLARDLKLKTINLRDPRQPQPMRPSKKNRGGPKSK